VVVAAPTGSASSSNGCGGGWGPGGPSVWYQPSLLNAAAVQQHNWQPATHAAREEAWAELERHGQQVGRYLFSPQRRSGSALDGDKGLSAAAPTQRRVGRLQRLGEAALSLKRGSMQHAFFVGGQTLAAVGQAADIDAPALCSCTWTRAATCGRCCKVRMSLQQCWGRVLGAPARAVGALLPDGAGGRRRGRVGTQVKRPHARSRAHGRRALAARLGAREGGAARLRRAGARATGGPRLRRGGRGEKGACGGARRWGRPQAHKGAAATAAGNKKELDVGSPKARHGTAVIACQGPPGLIAGPHPQNLGGRAVGGVGLSQV
jgi:hypothetical protein